MSDAQQNDPTVCEECGKNPANVHVRRMVSGEETVQRLCVGCAQNQGLEPTTTQSHTPDSLAALIRNLGDGEDGATACPSCGIRLEQFRETGRLGCATCYETFRAQLEPLLRRVQGTVRHVGKTPVAEDDSPGHLPRLRRLNEELDRAVESEDYERAAALRDEIRRMEAGAPSSGELS